jgi:O-antigen/teichoic acid export membrane protein
MEYEAITTAACSATYLAAILYVVWTKPTLVAIFAALLLSSLVDAALGYLFLVRKFVRPRLRGHCGLWKELLKEAYPVGLRRILRVVSYRVDTVLLVALKGNVEAGLFHAVYKIVNGFAYLAETVVQAVYPILSRRGAEGDSHDTYRLTLKYLVILSLPLIITFGFFAPPVIRLVLGAKFLPAAWVMSVLGGALALLFVSTLMERMLIAHGRQTASSVLTAASVAVLVALDVALIPGYGAVGAAVATLIAEAILVAIYHVYILRQVCPRGVFGEAVRPGVAAAFTCLSIWGLGTARPVLAASLGLIVYLASLFLLGTFSWGEIAVVQESLRRRPRELAAGRPGG